MVQNTAKSQECIGVISNETTENKTIKSICSGAEISSDFERHLNTYVLLHHRQLT